MSIVALLEFRNEGIYCEQGGFWIDPWKPVDKAIVTHAHADHARWGMKHYLAHRQSLPVLRYRLGDDISVEGLDYDESRTINGVKISLHPAGHIPGSAQVRVEYKGEVWVASGDYKTHDDGLTTPFEPVKCDVFITESTFGLPVYKWPSPTEVEEQMNSWWKNNQAHGKTSILLGYSLGKAQRVLNGLNTGIGPIMSHGAIYNTNEALRSGGIELPAAPRITKETPNTAWKGGLIIAPPSALGSSWMKKFAPFDVATASGWMMLRGTRRRRNVGGFVLSDHADWNGLNEAIDATGAETVYVTHGYTSLFSEWLKTKGLNAIPVQTEYEGELSEIGESGSEKEKDEDS